MSFPSLPLLPPRLREAGAADFGREERALGSLFAAAEL